MIALDYQLARLDDLDNFNPLFIHNQLSQLWELLASLDRQVQELKKENAELRKAVAPAIALPEMGEALIRSIEGDGEIKAWRVEGGPMPNIEDDPCARLTPADFDYVPVEGEAWTPFEFVTWEPISIHYALFYKNGYTGWITFRSEAAARQSVAIKLPYWFGSFGFVDFTGQIYTEAEMIKHGYISPDEEE